MDLAIAGYFGVIFFSSAISLWLLQKEQRISVMRFKGMSQRLNEVEKIFSEVKMLEHELRRRQTRQASMVSLEQKLDKAEKELLAVKSKA